MSLLVGLFAVAAIAAFGSVVVPDPASRWFAWLALTAAGLELFLVIWSVLDWLRPEARDARRRASWGRRRAR